MSAETIITKTPEGYVLNQKVFNELQGKSTPAEVQQWTKFFRESGITSEDIKALLSDTLPDAELIRISRAVLSRIPNIDPMFGPGYIINNVEALVGATIVLQTMETHDKAQAQLPDQID